MATSSVPLAINHTVHESILPASCRMLNDHHNTLGSCTQTPQQHRMHQRQQVQLEKFCFLSSLHCISRHSGTQPWHNSNPFTVSQQQNQEMQQMPHRVSLALGPPVTGLVIGHSERNRYKDKYGQDHISNEANHYYYCNIECVRLGHPYFHRGLLIIEWSELNPIQGRFVNEMFGL